jgi:hypothetical protein
MAGRSLWIRVPILAAAILFATCAAHRKGAVLYNYDRLRTGLVIDPSEAHVGDLIKATLILTNLSRESLDLCFGRGQFYQFFGTDSTTSGSLGQGRPRCDSPIHLRRGKTAMASYMLEVPDVGVGYAYLSFLIEVVDYSLCSTDGCSALRLSSGSRYFLIKHPKEP